MNTTLHHMNVLAVEQPERVKDLAAKWEVWAARCNVNVASDNPNPKEKGKQEK